MIVRHRRPWSTPRAWLALAMGFAILAIALVILVVPGGNPGILPGATAERTHDVVPSPGPSQASGAAVEPSPIRTQLATETTTPTPAPTSASTPVPAGSPERTPVLPSWTGLAWSDPVVPFPHQSGVEIGQPGTSVTINDIVAWRGGYVGVGSVDDGGACAAAAFFRSIDGLHWEITSRTDSPADDRTPTLCPRFVARMGTDLIAIGQERIWRSDDGLEWTELDSSGLRAVWTSSGEELVDVAAGPAGIVVIGQPGNTFESIAAFSPDGLEWTKITLPANGTALAWDASTYAGGFVIVGRDGQPDGSGSPSQPYVHPGVGAPAAWTSADGRVWTAATVEGTTVKGGALTRVVAGGNGVFAFGSDVALRTQYEDATQSDVGGWSSIDGMTWDKVGPMASLVPGAAQLAADGTTIVALGDHGTVWTSNDGTHWLPIPVSGALLVTSDRWGPMMVGPATTMSMVDVRLWVTEAGPIIGYTAGSPDGFIVQRFQVGDVHAP